MAFKISKLATTPQEIDGVEQEYADGAFVTIARMNNPKYRALLNKLMRQSAQKRLRQHGRSVDIDAIDPEDDENKPIICRAMSFHILKHWKGFVDDDGEDIIYTHEKAEEWLLGYDKFFQDIVLMSNEEEVYAQAHKESLEGN